MYHYEVKCSKCSRDFKIKSEAELDLGQRELYICDNCSVDQVDYKDWIYVDEEYELVDYV